MYSSGRGPLFFAPSVRAPIGEVPAYRLLPQPQIPDFAKWSHYPHLEQAEGNAETHEETSIAVDQFYASLKKELGVNSDNILAQVEKQIEKSPLDKIWWETAMHAATQKNPFVWSDLAAKSFIADVGYAADVALWIAKRFQLGKVSSSPAQQYMNRPPFIKFFASSATPTLAHLYVKGHLANPWQKFLNELTHLTETFLNPDTVRETEEEAFCHTAMSHGRVMDEYRHARKECDKLLAGVNTLNQLQIDALVQHLRRLLMAFNQLVTRVRKECSGDVEKVLEIHKMKLEALLDALRNFLSHSEQSNQAMLQIEQMMREVGYFAD